MGLSCDHRVGPFRLSNESPRACECVCEVVACCGDWCVSVSVGPGLQILAEPPGGVPSGDGLVLIGVRALWWVSAYHQSMHFCDRRMTCAVAMAKLLHCPVPV